VSTQEPQQYEDPGYTQSITKYSHPRPWPEQTLDVPMYDVFDSVESVSSSHVASVARHQARRAKKRSTALRKRPRSTKDHA
jgi:hypothetical protein